MIRFIDLRDQINDIEDTPVEFAFYNTVTDSFCTFGIINSQTWTSEQKFREDYDGNELDRYLALMPDWVRREAGK